MEQNFFFIHGIVYSLVQCNVIMWHGDELLKIKV
jgi:hypothetical protein